MINARTILLVLTIAIASSTGRADEAPQNGAAADAEVVLNRADATAGKPVPAYTCGDVVFSVASAPQRSKAQGRVMFFTLLNTHRKGILNHMANEQPIPVKAAIK